MKAPVLLFYIIGFELSNYPFGPKKMSTINDSNAILNKGRMLIQHQAILTLIQKELGNPELSEFRWLDMGCGKGQLIINLEDNFTTESRSKINYSAYDLKDEYVTGTIKIAEKLGFKSFNGKTGDITDFPNIYKVEDKFEFISLTNAIHEFSPISLPEVLFESILRLEKDGQLFIYDMEQLPISELGAITWSRIEMQEILMSLLQNIPIKNRYVPQAGQWPHNTCNGWNAIINRRYIDVSNDLLQELKTQILTLTKDKISELIIRKLAKCTESLEALTKYGPETEAEEQYKIKQLFDFWALNRCLE